MQFKAMTPTLNGDLIFQADLHEVNWFAVEIFTKTKHWEYMHGRTYWSTFVKGRLALNYE